MFRPFKFSFAMDNSAKPGAVSEKLINSYLSESIPIFFGGVDIPDQLNRKAFVYCNLTYSEKWEDEFRHALAAKMGLAFHETPAPEIDQKYNYTARRIENLMPNLRPSAMPCIQQIMDLDQDDEKYKAMLAEPLIHQIKGSILDLDILTARVRKVMAATEYSYQMGG
jgi:hypothetical protein